MKNPKEKLQYITTAAIIAAVYAALTYFGAFFGLSYGPIQLRFSEVLTILPVFTPAAIPGLTIGCFIANIGSFNMIDMVFGTLATFLATVLTRILKDFKLKGIPFLAFFPPVIINALIIGLEIAIFFLPEGLSWYGFVISALQVGTGQLIVCYALGIPFYLTVKKTKLIKIFKVNTNE